MPSKTKPRRTPPARPEPQADPERQHEDAMRFLRQEYYGGVRGIVEDLKSRVASGEIASEDALNDAVHQEVDGSYWVIYTHANFQVLLCSDHHDASFEEYGEVPLAADGNVNWAALAFAALKRDVLDQMDAEGVQIVEESRRHVTEAEPNMLKVGSEKVAGEIAREKGLCWGWSVFGPGGWYVGTRIQLERIGVPSRDLQCSGTRQAHEYPARAKPGNWGPGAQWVPSEARRPRQTLRGARRVSEYDKRRPGRK